MQLMKKWDYNNAELIYKFINYLNVNMLPKQSVSVTELRRNTKKVFEKLKNEWELTVCAYNKPVAILKDLKDSSLNTKLKFDFNFWKEGIDADLILNYFKHKK